MRTLGLGLQTVWVVARREIRVRLRSRVFAITTVVLVGVAIGGILAASSALSGGSSSAATVQVGFSGGAGVLGSSFSAVASDLGVSVVVTEVPDAATGRARVEAGTLDLAVSGSAVQPAAVAAVSLPSNVEIALDAAVQNARLAAAGLSPAEIASVTTAVTVDRIEPAGVSAAPADQAVFSGLVVAILLFVSIEAYGNLVAQGVVEEKASRVIEILLASIEPADVLAGKIIGIGLVGLLQLGIVSLAALAVGGLTHAVVLPAIGVVELASYLAWFLLGYALYASAFAAAAVLVSRPEEIQSATTPVTLVFVVSYVLMFFALPDPSGTMSTALSLVPLSAPIFMPMRIAAGAAVPWQVALSMALTAGATVWVVRVAGRVYADSALHVGRRLPLVGAVRAGLHH